MKIRKLEVKSGRRVETGPTKIGDDWPGVFIRSDNAVNYATHLDSLLKDYPRCISKHVLEQLVDLLRSGWTQDNEDKPTWARNSDSSDD